MPIDFDLQPYGAYLAGRDTVIFDRRYRPIVRISPPAFLCHEPNGLARSIPVGSPRVTACRPDEWIEHDEQVFFYSDENPPHRSRTTRERLAQLIASVPELGAEIARREMKVPA